MATTVDPFRVTLPDGNVVQVAWSRRSGSRSVRMSVSSHGARVSSPARMPRLLVQQFLNTQKKWLAEHIHVAKELPQNELWFRGKPYKIEILTTHQQHNERVRFDGETCFVSPVSHTSASAIRTLERFLETKAGEVAAPLLQTLAQKMGVEVPQLRFRQTKSRWGSCSQHGAIMLNWRLIHAPDEVFLYVIVHELAHRVHMNHSKAFWELVKKFDPSYPIHQGWLKRHGGKCKTPDLAV